METKDEELSTFVIDNKVYLGLGSKYGNLPS
jgi:hypothetical protein